MTAIDAFRESMADYGLHCPDTIIPDGKIHRFHVAGDKAGTRNGWYVLYGGDGVPAGAFGSWKLGGETFNWCAKSLKSLSDAEQEQWKLKVAKAKKARDQEQEKFHAKARDKAQTIRRDSKPITEHPYLTAKGVKSYGLRQYEDFLIIPIRDTKGIIHSLQLINSNGDKRFLPGGAITGHFSSIDGNGDILLICEGYATGASLHEATGYPIACALNCGNLKPVCEALRKKSPDIKLIICSDDDYQTDVNPGLTKARQAAEAVGAVLVVPKFKDQTHRGTDFNDLHQIEGLEVVRHQIEEALRAPIGQAETPDDLLDFEIKAKPHLDLTKFSGITKSFVELATRNSEADSSAVLFTFLTHFGVEIGENPYFNIGDTVHRGRLAVVVVGETAKSRKGTSGKPVERLMSFKSLSSSIEYKKAWTSPGPFSSGEGIIYAVRDSIEEWDKTHKKYKIIDPGKKDKRLFILDEEFGGVLANTKREGNTLSMVIRCSWDSGNFDPLTKNSKISATGAHIGWVSHITQYELLSKLPECEGFNGFSNRILWVFSQRRKLVPMPEPMPTKELAELQYRLLSILNFCHEREREITFDEQAKEAWVYEYYQKLSSRPENGLLGVILNRSEAQVASGFTLHTT
jgi:putative DNA primase/helicase